MASDNPLIMGIVNVTPDSFSDGGSFFTLENAVEHALQLIVDGADILDIGGESSRPGADSIPIKEEIERVIPVIAKIRAINQDIKISVDTVKYEVAEEAIRAGANIINDVSGLIIDERLAELAAKTGSELVIMHIKGTPRNMQINPKYENVIQEVYSFLEKKIEFAKSAGVRHIIADVGIGFGKNYEHNLLLLKNIEKFHELNVPILLGISRKAFIGAMFNIKNPVNRDLPTVILNSILFDKKIDILRVHNVKNHYFLKKIEKNALF